VLSDGRRALKPVLDESGRPKVMLPQMIMAKFTQMLTGKAPKNEGLTQRRRKEATSTCDRGEAAAEPVVIAAAAPTKMIKKRGTRAAEHAAKRDAELTSQRAEGKYGQGQFKNEPWGLQSYQKRVYAVREFYRAALRKHEKRLLGTKRVPNGAALCAARSDAPLQRDRFMRPCLACPSALPTCTPPMRRAHTRRAPQPTAQHARTPPSPEHCARAHAAPARAPTRRTLPPRGA